VQYCHFLAVLLFVLPQHASRRMVRAVFCSSPGRQRRIAMHAAGRPAHRAAGGGSHIRTQPAWSSGTQPFEPHEPIEPIDSRLCCSALLSQAGALEGDTREAGSDADVARGNGAEPADLDPQAIMVNTDVTSPTACSRLDEAGRKDVCPAPALASSWDVSSDGKSTPSIFAKAPLVRWRPVTADDFVYSFHRYSVRVRRGYSYMLWPIRNAEAFNAGRLSDFPRWGQGLDSHTLQ